jgi:hypothetical protein
LHLKTVPQYLDIPLTDVAAVHIGKNTELISYPLVFCIRPPTGNKRNRTDICLYMLDKWKGTQNDSAEHT